MRERSDGEPAKVAEAAAERAVEREREGGELTFPMTEPTTVDGTQNLIKASSTADARQEDKKRRTKKERE